MKKTMLLTAVFVLSMGCHTVGAQDVKGDYRTMTTEQVEAIAAKAQSEVENLKDKVDSAKSRMKNAKKAYSDASKEYKEMSKQMNVYKKQLKDAQKALKLRAKLQELGK